MDENRDRDQDADVPPLGTDGAVQGNPAASLQGRSVLVTGGSGFIGRRLVARLHAAGARVAVLTRDPAASAELVPEAVRMIGRMEDVPALRPRIVVNLAGAGIADRPWTAARRRLLLESRVGLTRRLRETLSAAPPDRLVSASAIGWYGTHPSHRHVESDPRGTGFAADLCEQWETEAEQFAALGSSVVRARLGVVLGPGGMLGRLETPFRLGLGGRLGNGRQFMSWVHMEDVLELLMLAIVDARVDGAINVTAPNPVTNAEFTAALGAALGRPTVLPVPGFALRMLLGEMADELLLRGAAVLPERAESLGYRFRFSRIEAALTDLC